MGRVESCSEEVDCIVVGAGWTGLATAAALRAFGVRRLLLLEAGDAPGAFWSTTYDRICLHTPWHALPCDGGEAYFDLPMFKSRDEVCAYLRSYHARHKLEGISRFCHRLRRVEQISEGRWRLYVESPDGPQQFECRALALCVSKLRVPHEPELPGRDRFGGRCLHSSDFRSGKAFAGARAVVAGSGNSGKSVDSFFIRATIF